MSGQDVPWALLSRFLDSKVKLCVFRPLCGGWASDGGFCGGKKSRVLTFFEAFLGKKMQNSQVLVDFGPIFVTL